MVAQCMLLQMVAPRETFTAQTTLVLPLSRVYPEVAVELVRPGELPDTARPAAEVGLVSYVPPGGRHYRGPGGHGST